MIRHSGVLAAAVITGVAAFTPVGVAPASAAKPTCGGKTATILVTDTNVGSYKTADGYDVRGTSGPDVIVSTVGRSSDIKRGSLSIHALGGADLICTGPPADAAPDTWSDVSPVIAAGAGDDIVRVTDGWRSTVKLGAGDDRLTLRRAGRVHAYGGYGVDAFNVVGGLYRADVDGGPGRNRLDLHRFLDAAQIDLSAGRFLSSSESNARVRRISDVVGTPWGDELIGTTGANGLRGGGGNDRLVGRSGNDVLVGGTGRDRANGGPGRDRCSAEVRVSC